jgi:hypothetical protein
VQGDVKMGETKESPQRMIAGMLFLVIKSFFYHLLNNIKQPVYTALHFKDY